MKGLTEMTIADLKKEMAVLHGQNIYPHNQVMAWQRKYSIPAACFAFMLVALGMGVSHKRDGRLASFVLAIVVVFVYYILLYLSEALAKGGLFPHWFAWIAMWIPNVIVALWGLVLIVKQLRAPESSRVKLTLPFMRRRAIEAGEAKTVTSSSKGGRVVVVIKIPHVSFPRPSILDWYVLKHGLRVAALAGAGLLALFYVASFIELSNHLFTGRTTGLMIAQYLWWASPQFVYFLVPLAVLMGALVTIGALTKNSELIVMRACGISLYRAAAPLLILAIIGSAVLAGLEEQILAYSNRRANAINDAIRGRLPTALELNRRWVAANNGSIYQYLYFEPGRNRLNGLSIYEFADDPLHPYSAEVLRSSHLQRRSRSQGPGDVAGREGLVARVWRQGAVQVVHARAGGDGGARDISPASGPTRSTCRIGSSATMSRRSKRAVSTWCRTSWRCTASSRFRS